MKNSIKLILGVIIVVVIIAGAYFALGSEGFSITGAVTGVEKECIGASELSFFNACEDWKEGGYTDKPTTLSIMTDTSARQLCDRLLAEYKVC